MIKYQNREIENANENVWNLIPKLTNQLLIISNKAHNSYPKIYSNSSLFHKSFYIYNSFHS